MPVCRLAGAVTALLAAWSLVAALLVLGTVTLALLLDPVAGALALVVGIAALAVPGLLTLAAGALVSGRPEGPALAVAAAAVAVATATTSLVGPGLPGHPVVVAAVAVLLAIVVLAREHLVVPPALARSAAVGVTLLLGVYGLTALVAITEIGATVAVPASLAVVTAGVLGRAWRTGPSDAVGPTGAATAIALLLFVLAAEAGIDPLPAAVALGALAPLAVHLVAGARRASAGRMSAVR